MCLDVAQQGETKYDGKNLANKQYSRFFLYPDLSWIFPKGTSRNQDFLFFNYFLYFSLNEDHKRCNHKNWQLQLRSDVVYRNSASSLKSMQNPCHFFLYFPQCFAQFGSGPNGVKKLLYKF